jgi:hypothetical protein
VTLQKAILGDLKEKSMRIREEEQLVVGLQIPRETKESRMAFQEQCRMSISGNLNS